MAGAVRVDCAIIGGGIGGLVAANALHRWGIEAHVFEAAHALRAVGAGIWMPSNALQVLERLELARPVRDAGYELRRAEVHDIGEGLLQAVDIERIARLFGHGTVAIHRSRLQQVLASGLPADTIHTGRRLVDAEQAEDQVTLRFEEGEDVAARIVIGADGLRSRIRPQLVGAGTVRYSGQTSWRGIARFSLPERFAGVGCELWGPGRRFGFSAIAADETYWFAVMDAPADGRDEPGRVLPNLASIYAAFPDPVARLLQHTSEDAITRTDIADLEPIPRWHQGRAVLIGDAAHATTPNLGQGGAQAIEDAWVLAERLAANAGNHTPAFEQYQRIRKPKADRVVRTSWWLGKAAHVKNRAARAVRNMLLRHTPQRVTDRQFRDLFELNH